MDDNSPGPVFCSACFRLVPDGRRVCLNCSEPVHPHKSEVSPRYPWVKRLLWIGAGLFISYSLWSEAVVFFEY